MLKTPNNDIFASSCEFIVIVVLVVVAAPTANEPGGARTVTGADQKRSNAALVWLPCRRSRGDAAGEGVHVCARVGREGG